MAAPSAALEIRDLHYRYPDGVHALKGLSLLVAEGESVALLGQNGAGKSTLLLHLNGVLPPLSGEVRVAGLMVTKPNLAAVRARVGLVFQDPDSQLFMPTLLEDLLFGPLNLGWTRERAVAAAGKALAAVDLAGYGERMPHHLSYGERKRAALAAVLAMAPSLLALDEPTSNLDPRHRRGIISLLKGIAGTKIIATHDLPMARELCTRAVIIDGGIVAAEGSMEQLLNDRSLLERYGLI